MALNTIPSHPNANSYVTVTEADDYLLSKTEYNIWEGLTTDQKENFLKLACSQMEGFRYFGKKFVNINNWYRKEQKLAYPREGSYQSSNIVSVDGLSFTTSLNQNSTSEYPNKYTAMIVYEGAGRGNTFALTSFLNSVGTVSNWNGVVLDQTSSLILLPEDIIPENVKYAQIEQAFFLCLLESKEIDLSGKYDQAKIEDKQGRPFNPNAKQYLKGFITITGKITL
jgi:hypothetical protein